MESTDCEVLVMYGQSTEHNEVRIKTKVGEFFSSLSRVKIILIASVPLRDRSQRGL